jgi:ABC-type amino acid transport substrate-binding protein
MRKQTSRIAELKLYPTADEYKLDLENGRIDAVIEDVVVLSDWLATDNGACCKVAEHAEIRSGHQR